MALQYATSSSILFDSHFCRPCKGLLPMRNRVWRRVSEETTRRRTNNIQHSSCTKTSSIAPLHLDPSTLFISDIDPSTAKLLISLIGPFLSFFSFLFIIRIVMSWYPKLPVGEFPYVLAFAPTEPFLVATRKVIPPLGGVDVTPVVWFGLVSFLNEILVGPQGLLLLLSQQQV